MMIFAYFCGQLDHSFTDKDTAQVEHMCRKLDSPWNDTWIFELENGETVMFWRKDGIIHGNIFGFDESDIPEESIANSGI